MKRAGADRGGVGTPFADKDDVESQQNPLLPPLKTAVQLSSAKSGSPHVTERHPLIERQRSTPTVVQAAEGATRKDERICGLPIALFAAASYILTSSSLILLNKHALSSFHFQCPNLLLAFHCILAVLLVKVSEALGVIKPLEPLKWSIIKIWFPVNLLFVGMIVTSFLALKSIGVGMFTVLKNLANFMTIIGDWFFFGRTYPMQVWACLFLMLGSAAFGGLTDLRFSWEGYMWQVINCAFTSGYALYLSGAMERVQQHTSNREKLGELSMVYYNNLLSIGPVLLVAAWYGELSLVPHQAALASAEFQFVAFVGGLLGFGISFASLWYLSRTTATVYSLTGSLNKVFVAVAGILLFNEASSFYNIASIAVGLVAGVIFVVAKAYVPK